MTTLDQNQNRCFSYQQDPKRIARPLDFMSVLIDFILVTSAQYSSLALNLDLHSKPGELTAPPHTPHTHRRERGKGWRGALYEESFAFFDSKLSERTDRSQSHFYLIKWMLDFSFFFVCLLVGWFHMSYFVFELGEVLVYRDLRTICWSRFSLHYEVLAADACLGWKCQFSSGKQSLRSYPYSQRQSQIKNIRVFKKKKKAYMISGGKIKRK